MAYFRGTFICWRRQRLPLLLLLLLVLFSFLLFCVSLPSVRCFFLEIFNVACFYCCCCCCTSQHTPLYLASIGFSLFYCINKKLCGHNVRQKPNMPRIGEHLRFAIVVRKRVKELLGMAGVQTIRAMQFGILLCTEWNEAYFYAHFFIWIVIYLEQCRKPTKGDWRNIFAVGGDGWWAKLRSRSTVNNDERAIHLFLLTWVRIIM